MTQFLTDNKDTLTLLGIPFGILISLAFGGVLSWRHKICLEYESRRDVALAILRDRFIQRTSSHYTEIADERRKKRTAVEEIYRRPEKQRLIKELADDLEMCNRVKVVFRWLTTFIHAAFNLVWAAIVLIFVAIAILAFEAPPIVWTIWIISEVCLISAFAISVTMTTVFDGRFIRLVHGIIEPEGE